jgi:2-oxoglutarate dehydrogenase E1 component
VDASSPAPEGSLLGERALSGGLRSELRPADVLIDRNRLRDELARRTSEILRAEDQLWRTHEDMQKERLENVRLVADIDRLRDQVERTRLVERERAVEIERLGRELSQIETECAELQGSLNTRDAQLASAEARARGVRGPDDEGDELRARLVHVPPALNVHRKLRRFLSERDKMWRGETQINWAGGELMALASLLREGVAIRFSGQDSQRGTFSHRHAVYSDAETGEGWSPLDHLSEDQGRFEIFNSPLSEFAVLGFEFGYSLMAPASLVVWEAQFGDFANGAQVIIDNFISSSEDKWNRISGLVMMLPHGFEGQGPEHSSARLERFLQMAAEDNFQICNLTTPAQLFHVLRRQAIRDWRKPLILMQPKSLLRFRPSFSPAKELTEGAFHRLLDDPAVERADEVTRLILCSGKVYYDLAAARAELPAAQARQVALIRVEQLYPFPGRYLGLVLERYTGARELVWAQEEPRNMGAWSFVEPQLRTLAGERLGAPRYIGRVASASPATGSSASHALELKLLLEAAYAKL